MGIFIYLIRIKGKERYSQDLRDFVLSCALKTRTWMTDVQSFFFFSKESCFCCCTVLLILRSPTPLPAPSPRPRQLLARIDSVAAGRLFLRFYPLYQLAPDNSSGRKASILFTWAGQVVPPSGKNHQNRRPADQHTAPAFVVHTIHQLLQQKTKDKPEVKQETNLKQHTTHNTQLYTQIPP